MRADEPIERDAPTTTATGRDAGAPAIYTLVAALRPIDPPAITHAPEVSVQAIEAARKRLDPRLSIDLTPTRVRARLTGPGWLVPEGWELRGRADRYGHLLVEPSLARYRVLPSGALRAWLGERRLDVAPTAMATAENRGDGPKRLGLKTRRVEVTSRSAKAIFELARVDGCADAGALLSRMLLELMGAPPSTAIAQADELPVHAELRWSSRGGLVFEGLALSRRSDLGAAQLAVPPQNAAFTTEPVPREWAAIMLTAGELASMHTVALEVGPQPLPPGDPRATLTLANATDALRIAWIDGAPAAWLAPRGKTDLAGLMRGKYQVEWRTFLGDDAEPPATTFAPGSSELGGADAGSASK
jgi:hypothetical protein